MTIDRQTKLEDIDPAWAWEAWQPTSAEPWDRRRAALLLRRAGFCASESTLREALAEEPQTAVDHLFDLTPQAQSGLAAFEAVSAGLAKSVVGSTDAKQLATWWLHRMLSSPQPLVEKLTLFWHGHFATGAEKVLDAELMLGQNQLLRQHAFGDFRAMVHGIAKDPAILIYLDSVTNRKAHANENFARELMELFCLGEGNYSEADVQQLARCFTGWEIRRKKFRFNDYQHDQLAKSVLGAEVQSGEEAVDRVLNHPRAPYFIARKLFRFFVCDEPQASDPLLEPLARQFSQENLSLHGMVRTMLGSRLMLSDWSLGRKVRSPVEMAIGLLRTLDGTTNLYELSKHLGEVGQSIFYPPNVKGWDGGRAWVNSSTLVGRANLVHSLIRDENTRFSGEGLGALLERRSSGSAQKFLDWFSELYLAVDCSPVQREQLLKSISGKSGEQTCRDMLSLLAAMPQFQLA